MEEGSRVTVLEFPAGKRNERSCWDCRHLLVGVDTNICLQFSEVILSETVAAADCPVYSEVPS